MWCGLLWRGMVSCVDMLSVFMHTSHARAGADDCFVYVDTWRHSKLLEKENVDAATNLRRRMVWTFKVRICGAID